MKIFALAIVGSLFVSAAVAQTTTSTTVAPAGAMMAAPSKTDSNQAVATTDANAIQPAKGSNSFTAGEAQRRIEKEGFMTVADLKKDDDGVWRGHAMKDGASVGVWLDYKGNIGRQ